MKQMRTFAQETRPNEKKPNENKYINMLNSSFNELFFSS
jgi:hypothetical protein